MSDDINLDKVPYFSESSGKVLVVKFPSKPQTACKAVLEYFKHKNKINVTAIGIVEISNGDL